MDPLVALTLFAALSVALALYEDVCLPVAATVWALLVLLCWGSGHE